MTAIATPIKDRVRELRRVPASQLRANPKNWRKHPKEQGAALAEVLGRIGFAGACLARETPDGLELIDGHLRAQTCGDQEIPVLILDVTEVEALHLLATIDPLGALAGTDSAKLDALIKEVGSVGTACDDMLRDLSASAGVGQKEFIEGDAPLQMDEPLVKRGEVWVLGDHRLMCGDSSVDADVDRLLDGAVIHLVNTDPPYNVKVEPRSNNAIAAGHSFFGPNNATDVWEIKKVNPQSMVHLTEKPVDLAIRAIEYSSSPGQNVLDFFGGSGSTLMGAEHTKRRAFLMELDPAYCDVIINRWQNHTGRKAERA